MPSPEEDLPNRRARLLGEGFVIVVSILLAFGIDALWVQSQMRTEEREALVALETEFEANRSQVEEILEGHRMAREHIETLVRLTEAEIQALSQLEISQIMISTCNPWRFDPVLGTLDALISSGRLGILRHAALREALTTFRNLVADAAGDADFMDLHAVDVWRAEVTLGGPWTDPETELGVGGVAVTSPNYIAPATADDLIRVRGDAHFMGLVSRCHINIGYYVGDLERIHAQALLVLDRIIESC
jgi:hypothetical protein